MDARLQAKLLRAIQEREIDRVGGATPVRVDVRLIAATNRDLRPRRRPTARSARTCYFRLNVRDPAAAAAARAAGRHRGAGRALRREARHGQRPAASVRCQPAALARCAPCLARQRARAGELPCTARCCWPRGAAIERRRPSQPGTARPLPARRQRSPASAAALVGRTVAEVERDLIIDTLRHTLGNRTHAADHPRHLDPHAAQQAARVRRRRRRGAGAAGARCCLRSTARRIPPSDSASTHAAGRIAARPRCTMAMPAAGMRRPGCLGTGDIALAGGVLAILVVLILPLPAFLLDLVPRACRSRSRC